MGEVPLARLWLLADGTTCLLLKNGHSSNWALRVQRGPEILRREDFSSPLVAMDQAKVWRLDFDPIARAS